MAHVNYMLRHGAMHFNSCDKTIVLIQHTHTPTHNVNIPITNMESRSITSYLIVYNDSLLIFKSRKPATNGYDFSPDTNSHTVYKQNGTLYQSPGDLNP